MRSKLQLSEWRNSQSSLWESAWCFVLVRELGLSHLSPFVQACTNGRAWGLGERLRLDSQRLQWVEVRVRRGQCLVHQRTMIWWRFRFLVRVGNSLRYYLLWSYLRCLFPLSTNPSRRIHRKETHASDTVCTKCNRYLQSDWLPSQHSLASPLWK